MSLRARNGHRQEQKRAPISRAVSRPAEHPAAWRNVREPRETAQRDPSPFSTRFEGAAARRGHLDSPAPAYELHDLAQGFVTIRRAEHSARVLAPAEEDKLLRRTRGSEAAQNVRRRAERIAVRADEQLSAADLFRKLVGHRGDGSGNGDDALDVALEAGREYGATAHRGANEGDLF